MRLDKFLKVSRLIKRRPMAKQVADQGRIFINGRTAKSSSDVQIGDEVSLRLGQKHMVITINHLQASSKKEEAFSMYTTQKEEPVDKA